MSDPCVTAPAVVGPVLYVRGFTRWLMCGTVAERCPWCECEDRGRGPVGSGLVELCASAE
jgi:hypothetical protein